MIVFNSSYLWHLLKQYSLGPMERDSGIEEEEEEERGEEARGGGGWQREKGSGSKRSEGNTYSKCNFVFQLLVMLMSI